jgi:hypothetical protein
MEANVMAVAEIELLVSGRGRGELKGRWGRYQLGRRPARWSRLLLESY